ncbi:unnamed protein product [Rhizophagus irregularis]|nr:unnamed protein product [Rhizophagus irregularis]CAB5392638.1 unnamed protein product [Rhizophagus irregularis]
MLKLSANRSYPFLIKERFFFKEHDEFVEYNNNKELSLGENLCRFLLNVPYGKSCNIGTYQIICNKDSKTELIVDIQSFVSAIILEIQERFPNRPLLNSMKIFNYTNWPNNREELTKYGVKELNILAEFYEKKQIIKIDNICKE